MTFMDILSRRDDIRNYFEFQGDTHFDPLRAAGVASRMVFNQHEYRKFPPWCERVAAVTVAREVPQDRFILDGTSWG